jgi:hypothetical protein
MTITPSLATMPPPPPPPRYAVGLDMPPITLPLGCTEQLKFIAFSLNATPLVVQCRWSRNGAPFLLLHRAAVHRGHAVLHISRCVPGTVTAPRTEALQQCNSQAVVGRANKHVEPLQRCRCARRSRSILLTRRHVHACYPDPKPDPYSGTFIY